MSSVLGTVKLFSDIYIQGGKPARESAGLHGFKGDLICVKSLGGRGFKLLGA